MVITRASHNKLDTGKMSNSLTTQERFNKYADNGLTGLSNCGNTCYLNTCLQILSHTYELNDILNNDNYRKYLKKTPEGVLLHEWDELRKLMWSENCIVTPNRFLRVVQSVAASKNRHLFTGYDQNDMTEFLLFVMECFHEGLSREVIMDIKGKAITQKDFLAKKCYERMVELYQKSYSELLEVFFGIQVWTTRVVKNGNVSMDVQIDNMNPDPFMSLDLWLTPQSPAISLVDCISKNLEPERIDGFTDADGNPKERVLRFWNLPQILMINIKRYTPFGQKIRTQVRPDNEIDLSSYIIGYTNKQSGNNNHIYELFGAAVHAGGSIHGGHYYALIKTANGKWYEFNDTNVSEIKENSPVLNTRLSEASCFFYRKK